MPALLVLAVCAPAPALPVRPPTPSPEEGRPSRLILVSVTPAPATLPVEGLTGANKPNGIQYRLRTSVPDDTPGHVPREVDGLRLWIAEPVAAGWLAFYRGSLEQQPGSLNDRYRALLLGAAGSPLWRVELDRFLSRPSHLEIQDVRLHGGDLLFNEACQSYSSEADGRCSSLVRLDPRRQEVVWRTAPLVSNDIFIVHGELVVAGYGFTGEPDHVQLIDARTGEVLDRAELDTAHSYLEMRGDRLHVVTRQRHYRFDVR